MIKVLLVDDETYTREGVNSEIAWYQLGITNVDQAINGVDALNKATIQLPDILITDVRMPQMNGIELAYKLQTMNPNLCIIFMSGYSDKAYLKSAIDLKAVNYIEKPLDMEELTSAIQKAVDLHLSITRNNRVLNVGRPLVKNDFALKITKRITSDSINHDLLAFYPEIKSSDFFKTTILQWIPEDPFLTDLTNYYEQISIQGIIRYFSHFNINAMIGIKDSTHLIIHLASPVRDQLDLNYQLFYEWIYDTILTPQKATHQNDKGTLYLSVSPVVETIFSVHEAYSLGVVQLQRLFFHPKDTLIEPMPHQGPVFEFDEQTLLQFGTFISNGQKDEAIYLVRNLSAKMRLHDGTLDKTIRDIYFRFLMEMMKTKDINLSSDSPQSDSLLRLWDMIAKFNYLQEIEQFLIAHIESYFDKFDEQVGSNLTCSEILRYIHKNYQDPELSLTSISDYTFLSQPYICVIFKKVTNQTVIQYIKDYRIEKSLELLKNRQLKMNDIANQVGYSDANYFAKTFKKIKGLSPSDFRERYFNGRND